MTGYVAPSPAARALIAAITLFLSGCAAVVTASTPTATPVSTPTATPDVPTFEEIEASWKSSDTLGHTHLSSSEEDITCESCHGDVSPAEVSRPEDRTCLTCHGGSVEAVIELTENQEPNPHPPSHMEQTSCTLCHRMHKPYRDPCSYCH